VCIEEVQSVEVRAPVQEVHEHQGELMHAEDVRGLCATLDGLVENTRKGIEKWLSHVLHIFELCIIQDSEEDD
jgi:hypothetical protein